MTDKLSCPVIILSEQDIAAIYLREHYQTHYSAGTKNAEVCYQTQTTELALAVSRQGHSGFIYCSYADLAILLEDTLSGTDIRLLPDEILIALVSAWLNAFSAGLSIQKIKKEKQEITGISVIYSGSIFIFSDISLIHSHLKSIPDSIAQIPIEIRLCSPAFYLAYSEILTLHADDLIISPLADNNSAVSVYYRHYSVAAGIQLSNKVTIRKMTTLSRHHTSLSPLKGRLYFELAETEISLAELAGMKTDSLIELTDKTTNYIRIFCDETHIANGILVSFQQRLAVQIKEFTGLQAAPGTAS